LAKLIIYEEDAGEETIFEDFELLTNRILIGASPDNQLVLEAPDIDPAHASLELRYDHWVLQDLGAPGGTAVNGVEIFGPYHLNHGDLIELGSIKLKFQENELQPEPDELPQSASDEETQEAAPMQGRVWFTQVAGITLLIILFIIFLVVVGDYLNLVNMSDLLPHWFPKLQNSIIIWIG
jgi:pSer/pThr/pTyr-binding forkhead associated (FHA) protein